MTRLELKRNNPSAKERESTITSKKEASVACQRGAQERVGAHSAQTLSSIDRSSERHHPSSEYLK